MHVPCDRLEVDGAHHGAVVLHLVRVTVRVRVRVTVRLRVRVRVSPTLTLTLTVLHHADERRADALERRAHGVTWLG